MSDFKKLASDILLARRELKNIRQECMKQKASLKSEVALIQELLKNTTECNRTCSCKKNDDKNYSMSPIGFISSCFKNKNGIPRQPSLCPAAKGTLSIEKKIFNNPEHSFIGLDGFSYIWVLFVFHKNGSENAVKAKVHPPRLNGSSVGVFSTRSPHRPCAIGLSLIKLEKLKVRNTLFLSGIDLLDGTPVLDIKPYIPFYDIPPVFKENPTLEFIKSKSIQTTIQQDNDLSTEEINDITPSVVVSSESKISIKSLDCNVASYLTKTPQYLDVLFTNRALKDLENFHIRESHKGYCDNCFNFTSHSEAKQTIVDVLKNDPRSVYRRNKCSDRLYYFHVSDLHVTCWFDENIAEVLQLKSIKNTT
ncbi:hypothetical protein CEXT_71161 [Caerostris extrusa]|uniref:TsaA-like domain-containing protein n=1 Tax=Caerostris extrusa TaxID=172846 RepID=A0AAV4Y8S6_CAEEX|nr:hypothetical protein CEXT_71161 [Caerostris extrusa]